MTYVLIEDHDYECDDDNEYEYSVKSIAGEIFIFAILLIELIPCTVVPYIFYFIPLK